MSRYWGRSRREWTIVEPNSSGRRWSRTSRSGIDALLDERGVELLGVAEAARLVPDLGQDGHHRGADEWLVVDDPDALPHVDLRSGSARGERVTDDPDREVDFILGRHERRDDPHGLPVRAAA